MASSVEYTETALKQLRKLDKPIARRVVDYLDDVSLLDDPRDRGKALTGDRAGIWRYRVGDYRVLCELIDSDIVILVVTVAHRREAYDG